MPDRQSLVLLPGLLCDERLWRDQAEGLSDIADVQIADLTQHDRIADLARHVLDHAPQTFALAGLSMGGYVSMEIMRQAPERVTRLALIDTMARQDTPQEHRQRRGLLELGRSGRFSGVGPRLLGRLIHPSRVDTPLGEEVIDMTRRVGQDAYIRQQTAILHRPDSTPGLASITQPTMIVVGADDVMTPPEESKQMAERIPNATLHVLADCGHLPTMEKPRETLGLLREWLR